MGRGRSIEAKGRGKRIIRLAIILFVNVDEHVDPASVNHSSPVLERSENKKDGLYRAVYNEMVNSGI